MPIFVLSLIVLMAGLAVLAQRVHPRVRLAGLLLLAVGLAGALWRHPATTEVASARSRNSSFCAAVADDLDTWHQTSGRGVARPRDTQSKQWDALGGLLNQAVHYCTKDSVQCDNLSFQIFSGLGTAAINEQYRTDLEVHVDIDAAIATISTAVKTQKACPSP